MLYDLLGGRLLAVKFKVTVFRKAYRPKGVFAQPVGDRSSRRLDRDGVEVESEFGGLLAVCVQHEIDHLDGKLFVDYLSEAKRQRIRKRLEKDRRYRQPEPAAIL